LLPFPPAALAFGVGHWRRCNGMSCRIGSGGPWGGNGSNHPAIKQQSAMNAAVKAKKFFIGQISVELLYQVANDNHGSFPFIGAELQGVDGGAGNFKLRLKRVGGHGWWWWRGSLPCLHIVAPNVTVSEVSTGQFTNCRNQATALG